MPAIFSGRAKNFTGTWIVVGSEGQDPGPTFDALNTGTIVFTNDLTQP